MCVDNIIKGAHTCVFRRSRLAIVVVGGDISRRSIVLEVVVWCRSTGIQHGRRV